MNNNMAIEPVQYIMSEDRPIYYGEIEVIHNDCPFLSISKGENQINFKNRLSNLTCFQTSLKFSPNQLIEC